MSDRIRTYILFGIVVVATALGSLTQTSMNVMLTGVQESFQVTEAIGQWLTTIYMLTLGITVPIVTFLSRRVPLRRLLLVDLGIFIGGTAIGGCAPTFGVLVVGRVLEAIATGITLPLMQTIAMTRFPPGQNATAMGIGGIAMGFAPNIGPLVGGVLLSAFGWRSYFLVAGAIAAGLAVATAALVRREPLPPSDARLDGVSLLLSTLGFGGLLLGFSNGASYAIGSPFVWAPLVVGAGCLGFFVRRQRRIASPLISMEVFRSRAYRVAFVAQNLLFASFMGITLVVPLFVEHVSGASPVDAGLVFLPATLLAVAANPLAGFATDRIGVRPVALFGGAFLFGGAVLMATMDATTPLWLITVFQTVRGLGVSVLVGPFASWGLAELAPERSIDGSAFFTLARQACAALGTALMMIPVFGAIAGGAGASSLFNVAFGVSALFALGTLVVSIGWIRPPLTG